MKHLNPSQDSIIPYGSTGSDEIVEIQQQPVASEIRYYSDFLDSICPTPEQLADYLTEPNEPTFLDRLVNALRLRQQG
ncbi:hypothetical protein kac68v162_gp190 [Nodularia phage vB_NspS-kac68v162]|uniref:Uncharacterized protein n=1 Tax=Nodularia phage vB_NspS-kac68v162 TaxID=2557583 RepID=A0A482MKA6_9CAUD|nr:hypothetical protein kac68v162_gp190 [Nodularia phage vB_NspS-kac68v162]